MTTTSLDAGQAVQFGLNGQVYEIDGAQAEGLAQTLDQYVEQGRHLGSYTLRPASPARDVPASELREWAMSHGIGVAMRGKIPFSVRQAYADAHA